MFEVIMLIYKLLYLVINYNANMCKQRRKNCLQLFIPKCVEGTHHDSIDDIITVIFKCFDSFSSTDIGLRHDQFNILGLNTRLVNLCVTVVL